MTAILSPNQSRHGCEGGAHQQQFELAGTKRGFPYRGRTEEVRNELMVDRVKERPAHSVSLKDRSHLRRLRAGSPISSKTWVR